MIKVERIGYSVFIFLPKGTKHSYEVLANGDTKISYDCNEWEWEDLKEEV